MRTLAALTVVLAASCGAVVASLPKTDLGPRSWNSGPRSSVLDQREAIDKVFSPWTTNDSPGCAAGVFKDGTMQYARGYGMASLEHGVPITPASVFYAGSVSKQFTAMAAALAIKQRKLAYEDPIRKYLPELPAYADPIKVRHLVHHTSGLRDYNTLLSMAGRRDEEAWDNRAVLRITTRQRALNFEPGAEYLYSNTGYTLLATIVERATGTPFATYTDEQIFRPLRMTNSHFHTDARRLVRNRALGYGGGPGAWTLDTPINERAGAGGLYTTIPDLLKWNENFDTGKVGGAEVIKQVLTPGTLNDGKAQTYAWGLQINEYRGVPIVEHSGSLGGYRAHVLRIPSQHASVALLCNASSIAPNTLARRVADLIPGIRFPDAVPTPARAGEIGRDTVRVPSESADGRNLAYAGTYYSAELEAEFVVSANGTDLYLQRRGDATPLLMEPTSVGVDDFRVRGMIIRFTSVPPAPAVTGLTVDAGRVRGITFVRR